MLLLRDTRLIYLQYNSVTIFRPKFAMPFTALLDVRRSSVLGYRIGADFVSGLIIFGIAVAEGSPVFFAMHRLCANSLTLKGIIIMRTWAIWGRKKSIGIFLISLFTASLITACVCLALFEKSTHCEFPYIPAQSDSASHSESLDVSCSDVHSRPSVDRQGLPCRPCKYRCCRNLC